MGKLTIAILGNHKPSFSTESDIAWTFEHLNHKVLRFQENEAWTDAILRQCLEEEVDLFLYVHTHGWSTPGGYPVDQLLILLKAHGIVTASFHLDKFWQLEKLDHRESQIGQHAFWHTQYVFTSDGGHQKDFKSRGVNHHWLPPALVEHGCYSGTPRDEYRVPVGFVGSKRYHPEYEFRTQLINWLERTYGSRFRRFAGDTPSGTVREGDLNDVYASIDVVAGDSCFGGEPRQWSDRVPETLGRHGFLIHPETEGLNIPGLVTFPAGDLNRLKELIDYYLEHEEERREAVSIASKHVKEHETYTNRVQQMLKIMELA